MEKELDIKLIAHAKDYIDALAKGINPFTGEEVPEGDIINHVKISRCLFYVADVLEGVIENGGITPPKKNSAKKISFDTEGLDLSRYPFSQTPVKISDIAAQINALRPENMTKLKITAITDWLVDLELLEVFELQEKTRKFPTSLGQEMGIFKEDRMGIHGAYTVVLYSEKAQHFIVDNLQAILDGGYNATKSRASQAENSAM